MDHNPYAAPHTNVDRPEPPTSLDRPRSVVIAVQLLWAGLAVGLLGPLVHLYLRQSAIELAENLGRIIVVGAINFGIWYFLLAAAWLGRGWSRVVQAVLTGVGVAAIVYLRLSGLDLFRQKSDLAVIWLISNLAAVAGIALLFMPGANAWYRAMRAQRQGLRR